MNEIQEIRELIESRRAYGHSTEPAAWIGTSESERHCRDEAATELAKFIGGNIPDEAVTSHEIPEAYPGQRAFIAEAIVLFPADRAAILAKLNMLEAEIRALRQISPAWR